MLNTLPLDKQIDRDPARRPLLSLVTAVARLSPDEQRTLCMAVISEAVGCNGEFRGAEGDERQWRNIVEQATRIVCTIVDGLAVVPRNETGAADSDIAMPDLNELGIRMCTACGCTDDHGCRDGCWWVGPTLCSSCQRAGEVPAAVQASPPLPTDDQGTTRADGLVRLTLEISTAHLQRGDRLFLEFASDAGARDRIGAMVGPHGWLIAVDTPRTLKGLSANLAGVLDRAKTIGCTYTLFHVDGHRILGLPTFPTEEEENQEE